MSRRIVTLLVSFLAVLATVVAGGLFAFSGGQAAQATDRTLPVKAAFYYPWFPETENWTTQYHRPSASTAATTPPISTSTLTWRSTPGWTPSSPPGGAPARRRHSVCR